MNVYRLRPDNISNDTVTCLAQLHTLAKRGLIKGIGFVAYEEGEFITNAAGEALADPNNTIGMCSALVRKMEALRDGGDL